MVFNFYCTNIVENQTKKKKSLISQCKRMWAVPKKRKLPNYTNQVTMASKVFPQARTISRVNKEITASS